MQVEQEQTLVSVIMPIYNEAKILRPNLVEVVEYLQSDDRQFDWELLVVNDGSSDDSGAIAEDVAAQDSRIRVLHNPVNFGVGQAIRFGFANTRGDFIVTLDADLSYDVQHIDELVHSIQKTRAKIVLASPYMKGGTIKNVPRARLILSKLGNRFLRIFANTKWSTLTSMVRVYDGPFVRGLDLRSMGLDIMPETLHKAMVLQARIVETPARLDWGPILEHNEARTSSTRVFKHVVSTVLSGFVFRPFMFLVLPGLLVAAFALYVNFWMVVHLLNAHAENSLELSTSTWSAAFARAFDEYPHTFLIGFLSTMLAIQLVGLGLLALQAKKYFEDLFHLGSRSYRPNRRGQDSR